jgi:hypothetical protein
LSNQEEHIDIREKLKKLPKIQHSENFLHSLHSKIRQIDEEEKHLLIPGKRKYVKEFGWFSNLFDFRRRSWAIPAAGIAVITIIIFAVVFSVMKKQNESENQFYTSNQELKKSIDSLKNVYPDNTVNGTQSTQSNIAENIKKEGDLSPSSEKPPEDKKIKEEELKIMTIEPSRTEKDTKSDIEYKDALITPDKRKEEMKKESEKKLSEPTIEKQFNGELKIIEKKDDSGKPVEKSKDEKGINNSKIKKKDNRTGVDNPGNGTSEDKKNLEKIKDELDKTKKLPTPSPVPPNDDKTKKNNDDKSKKNNPPIEKEKNNENKKEE